jgi:hypothetical protein
MGRTNAPVTTAAVFLALYAAWHFTGGMHGTLVHIRTPPAASAVTAKLVTTSQCEPLASPALPPSPSPSPSPATSSSLATNPPTTSPPATSMPSAPQLCIGVQATQASIASGKTATWTIQLEAENGPATSVSVTLTSTPAGLPPAFTSSCPSGGGTATCAVGDMGTAVTPSSYQLQVQVAVPASTAATTLTLVASADTSPSMTATPAAGQSVAITHVVTKTSSKPTPSAARTPAVQPTVVPATQPVQPFTGVTAPATAGQLPTAAPVTTTVAPGSMSSALPQITPVVATAPVPAVTVASSPAANIQAAGVSPSASPAQTGEAFSVSIGMSAQTAQTLGWILLTLVVTLVASKLISGYISRTRQPRPRQPRATNRKRRLRLPALLFPHLRLPAPHLPRWKQRTRTRPSRAERSATREQNWRRYLQSQRPPGSDDTSEDVLNI